jgi:hypothetical protein
VIPNIFILREHAEGRQAPKNLLLAGGFSHEDPGDAVFPLGGFSA